MNIDGFLAFVSFCFPRLPSDWLQLVVSNINGKFAVIEIYHMDIIAATFIK